MFYGFPVLVYHKIDSRREFGITSLSPERFEKQIQFLSQEGYISLDLISPQSLIPKGAMLNKIALNKAVLLTFDDGYDGIYAHAYPILKEYKASAIVFVTTGYIGKYNSWDKSPGPRFEHLSWSHIKEMSNNGITFGSHGVNHTFITRQNDRTARYEIEASKKELEDGLGKPIHFFSYPYGDYDSRIARFVQEAGYDAAFSLRPEIFKFEFIQDRIMMYTLPRIAIYLVDNMRAFKAKTGCIRSGSLPYTQKVKNRLINKCAYASILANRLRAYNFFSLF